MMYCAITHAKWTCSFYDLHVFLLLSLTAMYARNRAKVKHDGW